MPSDIRTIADSFDRRAASYARSDWHKRYAERLVELCALRPGDRVLDAGTGTGFAALAAARVVGVNGRVCGVDVSGGMLRQARNAANASGATNVEFIEADASRLPDYESGTFDVVTCSAGLLYMPVGDMLREWRRLLKACGRVAFSAMQAGSPRAGYIFRDCARMFGVLLQDPSAPLGSTSACRSVLEQAGFEVVDIVSETIEFTPEDLSAAWESNFRSAAHSDAQRLGREEQRALRSAFLSALERDQREHPGLLNRAAVLYAFGRR